MNPIDALMRKCQEQEKRIQQQEIEIADWISVFGHISESPDTAGNMINERMDGMQSRIKELEAKLELQPCGHPNACIVQGEQVGPGEFVHYCGWCQSLDVARWQAEQAILGSLRVLAKGELDRIEQHGGTMAFVRRVLALAEEGLT